MNLWWMVAEDGEEAKRGRSRDAEDAIAEWCV
jgi:hypothetical protein